MSTTKRTEQQTPTAGVPRIETVGALVRGRYGNLGQITGVIESSRCSMQHLSKPGDVVVTLEPIGPGYNHRCAWASDLTLAEEGDVGAHPHKRECPCGEPYDEARGGRWYPVAASWRQ
jgi:hypothetical protein